jgi:BlaI family penicillinase repressor
MRRRSAGEIRLTKQEFLLLEALWTRTEASVREIHDGLNEPLAYTTVQTVVYRLEVKGAVKRTRKVGNCHMFGASITRDKAQSRLIDDLLAMLGGRSQPLMAHLIESGKLTLDDVKDAERALKKLKKESPNQNDR